MLREQNKPKGSLAAIISSQLWKVFAKTLVVFLGDSPCQEDTSYSAGSRLCRFQSNQLGLSGS